MTRMPQSLLNTMMGKVPVDMAVGEPFVLEEHERDRLMAFWHSPDRQLLLDVIGQLKQSLVTQLWTDDIETIPLVRAQGLVLETLVRRIEATVAEQEG